MDLTLGSGDTLLSEDEEVLVSLSRRRPRRRDRKWGLERGREESRQRFRAEGLGIKIRASVRGVKSDGLLTFEEVLKKIDFI